MKNKILIILCLGFAALVFSRAYAVSADITAPAPHMPARNASLDDRHSPAPDNQYTDENPLKNGSDRASAKAQDECLTGSVLEVINADKARLIARSEHLAEREAALAALESTVGEQVKAAKAANAALKVKIDLLTTTADADLKHLVGMYQTMKPSQAADIFDSMDPAFAAGFLREMDSNAAGLIMANMDARKSYAISVIIAGKNAQYRLKG